MTKPQALVIDDEPDICELLALTLGRMEIETEMAADVTGAKELVAALRAEGGTGPELDALEARIGLAEGAGDLQALRDRVEENPSDLSSRTELGRALFAAGSVEEALETLLDAVQADPAHDGGAARKAMLEVFEALGEESPFVADFRRRLQMVLF